MLTGKSILHINQGVGKCFSLNSLEGYYNDLTEKVLKDKSILAEDKLPKLKIENGDEIDFPTEIFQYGLGSYDLFLLQEDELFLRKFKLAAEWALENQEASGAWNNFYYIFPDAPYCAMTQGEGISLLLRAHKQFGEVKFFESAKKALNFMLTNVESGGTTIYDGKNVILMEYTNRSEVLNGWIFALWGIYDFILVDESAINIQKLYNDSVSTLILYLPRFSNRFWSNYNLGGSIASPFYHRLHIAQMKVMYQLTKNEIFNSFAERWMGNDKNKFFKILAFVKKAYQKILEED